MNTTENYPNADNRENETGLPDELATLKSDLETLSGLELEAWLQRWQTLLLSDTANPSLMLTVFFEVRRKVTGNTPVRDCLSYLDFLAQLKQALFSHDVFSYGGNVYSEYIEGLYALSGCCSYYFKPDFLQKYPAQEAGRHEQARRILEEHYQNDMSRWLEADLNDRVGYDPSPEEIQYLEEQAQAFIREGGNLDRGVFFLYRAVLLSLKRCQASDAAQALSENEQLMNCLSELAVAYQISSDDVHALEVLECAQKLSDQELAAQDIAPQKPDGDGAKVWADSIRAGLPESHCRLRWQILRRKGHVQDALSRRENALSCYQEALSFAEAVFGSASPQAEESRTDLALCRAKSGETQETTFLLLRLKNAEQAGDLDTVENLHGLISEMYEDAGDYDQAVFHFQKKVQILADQYGDDSDVAADYYNMFGELYERAGRYPEARDCYEHAMANYRAYLLRTQEEDADDPENTLSNYEECLYNTGRMHREAGEYEAAVSHFQEALEIYDSRSRYSGVSRGNYMRALAQTYEKISFMGKAVHYYLWAWDTYHTVAEFNKVRERNVALFESETEECEANEEQVRLHLSEIGHGQMFQPFEKIDYFALSREEQNYFLERFAQLVRRRLEKQELWTKWAFQWKIYRFLCMEWEQLTGTEAPAVIRDAFYILLRYLKREESEEELDSFAERFFAYIEMLQQPRETDGDCDDENDSDDDDYEDDSADEQGYTEERNYLPFYYALADLFQAIAHSNADFYPLQRLICSHLPVHAEVFTSVYFKEEEYTDYERQLRYRQVVSSPVFARWIAAIQQEIGNL